MWLGQMANYCHQLVDRHSLLHFPIFLVTNKQCSSSSHAAILHLYQYQQAMVQTFRYSVAF